MCCLIQGDDTFIAHESTKEEVVDYKAVRTGNTCLELEPSSYSGYSNAKELELHAMDEASGGNGNVCRVEDDTFSTSL